MKVKIIIYYLYWQLADENKELKLELNGTELKLDKVGL